MAEQQARSGTVRVLPRAEEEDWRAAHALALECDVRSITKTLERLAVEEERFAAHDELCGEVRALAARLREWRNDLAEAARGYRAAAAEPAGDPAATS
jgi:hypothetical protein